MAGSKFSVYQDEYCCKSIRQLGGKTVVSKHVVITVIYAVSIIFSIMINVGKIV